MSDIPQFLIAASGPVVTPFLMKRSLWRCGALETFNVGLFELFAASLAGVVFAAVHAWVINDIAPAAFWFFPVAIVMAWTDRVSAWAPTEPLIVLSCTAGLLVFPEQPIVGGVLVPLSLIAASHILWEIQLHLDVPVASPADVLALALPVLVIGFEAEAAAAYALTAAVMLAALRNPFMRRILSCSDAVENGASSTGVRGAPITFLSAILPVTAVMTVLAAAAGPVGLLQI